MVVCKCGKVMERVPDWLQGVNVEFVCNNCPDRKTKNIAFLSLEPTNAAAAHEGLAEIADSSDEEEAEEIES
jgi:hypothetical protein